MDIMYVNDKDVDIPEPLASVIKACERACAAECCGIGAFEFEPYAIKEWFDKTPDSQAILVESSRQLAHLKLELAPIEDVVISDLICDGFTGRKWIEILDGLHIAIVTGPTSQPLPPYVPPTPAENRLKSLKEWGLGTCIAVGCAIPLAFVIYLFEKLFGYVK